MTNKITLDRNFIHIMPFDMVFNEVHSEGYDPLENIEKFWHKYDINHSRDHILWLLLGTVGDRTSLKEQLSDEQVSDFSLDLFRALVAYYLVHYAKIDIAEIDVPLLPTKKLTEEELKFRQINYALFGKK